MSTAFHRDERLPRVVGSRTIEQLHSEPNRYNMVICAVTLQQRTGVVLDSIIRRKTVPHNQSHR